MKPARGKQRILLFLLAVQIIVPEVDQIFSGDIAVFASIGLDGGRISLEIEIRIDQQLENQGRTSLIPRHLGHDRCQVPSCAIPTDSDAGAIPIDLRGVLGHPLHGSKAGQWCGGKCVFRGQGIGHCHHETGGSVRQAAADAIVAVQISQDKDVPMKEDQDRERTTPFWRVDADRKSFSCAGNHAVFDTGNRFWSLWLSSRDVPSLAKLLGSTCMQRGQIERRHLIQIDLNLGIELVN